MEAQLYQQSETSAVSGGRSMLWLFQMYHHKMLLGINNSQCCTEQWPKNETIEFLHKLQVSTGQVSIPQPDGHTEHTCTESLKEAAHGHILHSKSAARCLSRGRAIAACCCNGSVCGLSLWIWENNLLNVKKKCLVKQSVFFSAPNM